MTPDDLARIHAAAFVSARAWSAAEFAGLLDQKSVILTTQDQAFVLGRVTADEAEVLTLACHPDRQRQGAARTALAAFEAQAQSAGAATCFLEVAENNTAARALYAASGYVQTGRRPGYYRTNSGQSVAALILSKALEPDYPASEAQTLGK